MFTVVRKVLSYVICAVAILLIAALFLLHPYYKMPPESRAELDARYAQYDAVVRNAPRSKEDFVALKALNAELSAQLPDNSALLKQQCPLYDLAELKARLPELNKLGPFEDRLRAVLAKPLVVRLEATEGGEYVNFAGARRFAYGENALAVLDEAEGRAEAAANRIALLRQLEGALERVTDLLGPMMGVAISDHIDKTTVYLLPKFTDDEIAQARDQLEKLPDVHQSFVASMEQKTARDIRALDLAQEGALSPAQKADLKKSGIPPTVLAIARAVGYLTRERYMTLSVCGRHIEAIRKWAAAGGNGPLPEPDLKALRHSPVLMMSVPNYAKLAERIHQSMVQRAAVLTAMKMELERRKTHDAKAIVIPYDDKNEIVIDKEYGCVQPKAPRPK